MLEFQQILRACKLEIHFQSELSYYTSPKETGNSFEANARIKAKALASVKNENWVVADDSGLEVEGINNMPGIHSARYAGDNASDVENTAKLLKMVNLRSAANRKAKFVCVICAIDPNGKEYIFKSDLPGQIGKQQKGKNGFGYDSVFIPEGFDLTLAELTPADKNKVSHRFKALQEFSKLFL